ncbi:proton-associated sugar transporter A [Phlebotomus argentipes]|uniref:proton-associated sugar transporter A n=1 Tax=Phlebotomus argentipes TaxID=94469 RepID=UPI002893615E|nr:proton-associated sugar transporter A [Phlebotomus argentipes]
MEKLHSYQGFAGRFHEWRDEVKDSYSNWRESGTCECWEGVKSGLRNLSSLIRGNNLPEHQDFSHLYRRKSRRELVRISTAVMGIEFSYAAETAFVSPTLLKIGVSHQKMTMVWALSPLIGFFLTPILGSLSDRCRHWLGRRRPFIILLSVGVLLGLLLVPNGENIGYAFGDSEFNDTWSNSSQTIVLPHRSSASDSTVIETPERENYHPWGIFFTILGTVLLDFDADACQSPSRAYLLDVTLPEDHAKGLSTFTIMAGLGGFMGYSLGGINWDDTAIGILLGGHVKAVFSLITVIFVICVSYTVTSFSEIPLDLVERQTQSDVTDQPRDIPNRHATKRHSAEVQSGLITHKNESYGALNETEDDHMLSVPKNNQKRRYTLPPIPINVPRMPSEEEETAETTFTENVQVPVHVPDQNQEVASLSHYLLSIVWMPYSLRILCLTNFFCWSAHVCYSLYFTDFVGEAVFGGDPKATESDPKRILYESGVRFGCWGMAMYSLSCACYSLIIEKLIKRFGAKRVYIGGLLFYCSGMTLMALTKHRIGVILFSWTAGVMYSTLFTMPYLLIAHYHSQGTFEVTAEGNAKLGTELRGLGTDVAIVSSMVFLAQFMLSLCMGTIVSWSGTTTAVVSVASFLSFCGALSATQVMYLDL